MVLTDPTGEGQNINTTQRASHGPEQLPEPVMEHLEGFDGAVVTLSSRLTDLAHVTTESGEPFQA